MSSDPRLWSDSLRKGGCVSPFDVCFLGFSWDDDDGMMTSCRVKAKDFDLGNALCKKSPRAALGVGRSLMDCTAHASEAAAQLVPRRGRPAGRLVSCMLSQSVSCVWLRV